MAVLDLLKRFGRAIWSFRQSRAGFIVLWILVILFLGRTALDSYAEYESLSLSIAWSSVLVALGFLALRNILTPLKWMYMLNVTGERMSYLQTSRAFYLSQMSSFIPGGVWQYLDLGYRASEQGKTLGNVAHTAVYVQGMTVAAGLFYAAVMAALYVPRYSIAAFVTAAAIAALSVYSAELLDSMKKVLERFNVALGDYRPRKRQLMILFVIALIIWPVNGAVLYFLVGALTSVTPSMFVPVSGVMAASWAAGFLVLVIPGGLGVREGSMILLLSSVVPPPVAIAVSVLARIVTLGAKVATAAVFAVLPEVET